MNKPSVSVLTITQLARSECLQILFDCVKNQSYKNIKEWIIVDGSKSTDEGMCNQILVNELVNSNKNVNFPIKYIPYQPNLTLGQLKNSANNAATGDYVIWMDDDDYHMSGRIEYSINKLMHKNKSIGGNTNVYLYDIDLNMMFKTTLNTSNIVPNTLVYKREFLNNHSYPIQQNTFDESLFVGNELNNVEILIPETTLIKIVHNYNTENKKNITNYAANNKLNTLTKLESNVRTLLIPDNFNDRYVAALKSRSPNNLVASNEPLKEYQEYDVVYFTGIASIKWDPNDKKLGGSEQAVVCLSEKWVELGKSVVVYGNFSEEKVLNGVHYKMGETYPVNKYAKVLIIWRTPGIIPLLELDFKADKVILDFHDNFSYTLAHLDRTKLLRFLEKVTLLHFKSMYHKNSFEEFMNAKINDNEYAIIPNGIRVEMFKNNKCLNDEQPIVRNPFRFCYCSSYDRGLVDILENVWPYIYAQEPRAEFHVYYGMDYIFDENFKNKVSQLLAQPGVMDHGRQSVEMIIREKYMSTFHLYLSASVAEIDCISVKESLVTGCIPIISNLGVFAERHGLQFAWEPSNKELGKMVAIELVQRMYSSKFTETASTYLKESSTIIDWHNIAVEWLKLF